MNTLAGEPCTRVFRNRLQLVWHQMKSKEHLAKHPIRKCIISNSCIVCGHCFATRGIAQEHLLHSYETGTCPLITTQQNWEHVEPKELKCTLCEPESVCSFATWAELQVHLCSHLPQPTPFAFPSNAFDTAAFSGLRWRTEAKAVTKGKGRSAQGQRS